MTGRYHEAAAPVPVYENGACVTDFDDFSAFFTDAIIAKIQANDGHFIHLDSLAENLEAYGMTIDNPDHVRAVIIPDFYKVFVAHHIVNGYHENSSALDISDVQSKTYNCRIYVTIGAVLNDSNPDVSPSKVFGLIHDANELGLFHFSFEKVLRNYSYAG